MLHDAEARKRMRQQKAEERMRKQAQLKKLMLRIAIAAVVLIACGILIFSLSRKNADTLPQTPPETQQPPANADAELPEEEAPEDPAEVPESDSALPPTTVIRYAAAGDLNVTAETVYSGGSSLVYTDAFLDVAHLLSDADIASINFEGNFYGEPYGSTFSAPQSLATALNNIGVDLVQMANSYSINRGIAGLVASLDAVRGADMEPLGAYASNEEFKASKGYTIRNINGIKLAFVAFTKGMDGMALPPGSEECVNILYSDYDSVYQEINTEKITTILASVAKEEPDLVIALLHWGSEFNNTISSSQEEIKDLMYANGVDAIIGTHSHYVQKISLDPETGRFIAYSLGDFFSNAERAGSEYSIILELEITKDNITGQTRITDYSYTPIFTVNESGQPLRVVRLQEAMTAYEDNFINKVSRETYDKMAYAMTRITARVAGE